MLQHQQYTPFPSTTLFRSDVVRQRDRQWLQARVLRDQERRQELVPGSDERDQGDRGDGGLHHRNRDREEDPQDRKSTRLNSSHVAISYAVCCLKKKNSIKK